MSDYTKVFNVHDYALINPVTKFYIPVGQGTTDDTEVIQAAIDAIADLYNYLEESVFIARAFTLYFPPGTYKISRPIVMGSLLSSIRIVGDNAVIQPHEEANFQDMNPESPTYEETLFAFQHLYCYDLKMSGMHFTGFEKAVKIFKDYTIDSGRVQISNCGFQNNTEVALELSYTSGLAKIENTKFIHNKVAMDIEGGDKVVVRECWIWSLPGISGEHEAQIINHSILTIESCLLVPGNPDELCKEPAWVNNYNSVTITETRQGGEDGGFTLVNNFAGVGDAFDHVPEVNAVRVKDCQCYATFGNIYGPNSSVIYAQPAILRYVSAIPNITAIEDNIGLILAKAIDFSKEEFEEDTESIQEMISESGATGNVVPFGVSVKVTNNVGGLPHSNGSHVPSELWQFVRDDDSLWPSKRGNELAPIGAPAAGSGSSVRFSFDYGSNLNTAYLINYVGFPNPGGSTSYSGGFVGLLKANGFYTGTDIAQSLALEPLFNKIGDGPDPSMWPTGMFSVNVCWEATDSDVMLDSVTNHNFYIEVTGGSLGYDSIKVTPLNSL